MDTMKHIVAILGALLVVVAGVAGVAPVVGQQGNQTTSPGSSISGAISAQREATSGELDNAVFKQKLRNAETAEERAAIIKERQDELANRSEEIRAAAKRLRNKSVDGEYVFKAAAIAQSQRNLVESVNQTEEEAKQLPSQALENANVNLTQLNKIRNNASELVGPQVAEAARGLAGNGPSEVGPPADAGAPEDAGPEQDETEEREGDETENADKSEKGENDTTRGLAVDNPT